eukprot:CAMPEP_0184409122 /NCGR_PEP_ID=MMETSP0738-20130409/3808_1 /TAXON_ID=385413 /ORGANISM="Thalassiosira miniscula, Strain CCMP1093" /LENGTH=85 /DNA_ID=CAMNT_0026766757 /DNA_START=406 /DNA_END=663 /DNA_ORIENTATION=-
MDGNDNVRFLIVVQFRPAALVDPIATKGHRDLSATQATRSEECESLLDNGDLTVHFPRAGMTLRPPPDLDHSDLGSSLGQPPLAE